MFKYILIIIAATVLCVIGVYFLLQVDKTKSGREETKLHKLANSVSSDNPIFVEKYPKTVIKTLWLDYSKKIQNDGRTLDRDKNLITTSEGQSYSMLQAVWMNDKETFDKVWKWTRNNLQKREDDELFAWLWGQDSEGNWDVIKAEGGMNTASDADQDIALALIFASKRWDDTYYLDEAIKILNDIWRVEVIEINGKPYLTAGNWADTEVNVTINPSYLSPAHYEVFAKVNPENDWLALKETSYEVLNYTTSTNLSYTNKNSNLPPDWAGINSQTGQITLPRHNDKTSDFSDDAIRVPFRVGLDYLWFNEEKAKNYLENNYQTLSKDWVSKGKLEAAYKQDGTEAVRYETLATYGATLPYFYIVNKDIAEEIYLEKLAKLYNPDTETFKDDLNYYDSNWVWFGMAFYNNELINLYE